jgi:hypothetical protein
VRVTSFGLGEIGSYALAVSELSEPVTPARLRLGRSVEGELDERDGISDAGGPYDSYGFHLDQDQRARFIATSDAFDTVLFVVRRVGDEFEVVTYDDDGQGDGTTNSRLVVVGDQPGDYELWVMSYDPESFGTYALESADLGPSPTSAETTIGATLTGTLQDGDGVAAEGMTYDGYAFDGSAGQRLLVTLSSTEFDTFLLAGAHGPDGLAAIAENDDAGGDTNSAITLTLPSDGRYEVWASSYAIGETGAYTLTLADLGPEPEPGSLLVGSTIRGSLSDTDPVGPDGAFYDAYRFTVAAGQSVRITATSNDIDSGGGTPCPGQRGQQFDADHGGGVLGHVQQAAGAVGGHGDMVFLIGGGRHGVDAAGMGDHPVLGDEGGGGDLGDHEAGVQAAFLDQKGGQFAHLGVDEDGGAAFGDDCRSRTGPWRSYQPRKQRVRRGSCRPR